MIDSKSQLFSLQSRNLFFSIKDFDVLDQIGQGAFSQVFLAIHKRTHKKYALKEFNINRMNQSAIQNIVKEIQIHRTVQHPDIVEFIDHFYSKNFFYIVLEYVNGENLYSFMKSQPQLKEYDVKLIFNKVLGGIKYLHSKGIVLRDLKPENIIISRDKNIIKLCDFGWASFIQDKEWLMKMAGTYSYMAPESLQSQMQGFETDIWALGIFLYELIHGREPYPGNNPQSVLNKIRTSTINYEQSINPQAKDLISKILKQEKFLRLQIRDIQNHFYLQQFQTQEQQGYNKNFDDQLFTKKTLNDSDLLSTFNEEKEQKRTKKKNYNNNKNMIQGPRKNQSQICIQKVDTSFEKNLQQQKQVKIIMRDHSSNVINLQTHQKQEQFFPKVYYVDKQNNNIDLYSTQNLFSKMTYEQNLLSNNNKSERTVSIDRNITKSYGRNFQNNKGLNQEYLFFQTQKEDNQYGIEKNKNSNNVLNNLSTEDSVNKVSFVSKDQMVRPQRRLTKQFQQKLDLQYLSSKSIPIKTSQKNPLQQRVTLKKQNTLLPKILIDGQEFQYSTKQIKSAKSNNQEKQQKNNFYKNILSYNNNKDQGLLNPLRDFNTFQKLNLQQDLSGQQSKKKISLVVSITS